MSVLTGMTRRRLWLLLALVIGLALALTLVVVDRRVNELTPRVVEYLNDHYGLDCRIGALEFAMPNGLRARDIECRLPDGRVWLRLRSLTARVRIFTYLFSGKLNREILSGVAADGVEVILRRRPDLSWELPRLKHRAATGAGGEAAPGGAVSLAANNLRFLLVIDGDTFLETYDSLDAAWDPATGAGSLEIRQGEQGLFLSATPAPDRRVDLRADSFSLAPLAPLVSGGLDLSEVTLSVKATAGMPDTEAMTFVAAGHLSGLALRHEVLSSRAASDLVLDFSLQGRRFRDRWELQRFVLLLAGETVAVQGRLTVAAKPVLDLIVSFPDFSFERAVAALPLSLRPDLPDLAVTGRLAGDFSLFLDFSRPESLDYHYTGVFEPLKVLALGPQVNPAALKKSFRHVARLPNGETKAIRVGPENPAFVALNRVPKHLVNAVLSAEDGAFFAHHGFSPRPIHDAMIENLRAGRVVRGASTISMQLAKNLYLSRERTLSRKLEEAFITTALEQELTKERMMEIYLNIIEWGDGLYGLGPAAQYYFQKTPEELKPVESAFLASIIARPRHGWKPDPLGDNRLTEAWWQYLRLLLCKMYARGDVTPADLVAAGVTDTMLRKYAGDTVMIGTVFPPEPQSPAEPAQP